MYRKVFTPNLKKSYTFTHNKKEIVSSLKNVKKIEKIEKVLVENNKSITKAWSVVFENTDWTLITQYLDDTYLKELK